MGEVVIFPKVFRDRNEEYFDDSESFSLTVFTKEFTKEFVFDDEDYTDFISDFFVENFEGASVIKEKIYNE